MEKLVKKQCAVRSEGRVTSGAGEGGGCETNQKMSTGRSQIGEVQRAAREEEPSTNGTDTLKEKGENERDTGGQSESRENLKGKLLVNQRCDTGTWK